MVSECSQRKVAQVTLDASDLLDVIVPSAVTAAAEVVARLIVLQQPEQYAIRRCYLGCHGLVVAGDELRRSGFTTQRWPTFPSIQYVRRVPSASRLVMLLIPLSVMRMLGLPLL
jgi:hypothetical protein